MSRHEKDRLRADEHEPQRLDVSRMVMRLGRTDSSPDEGSTFTMKRRARGLVRRITSMDLPSIFNSSRLTRRAGLAFASPRIFLCAPILESPHNASHCRV